MMSLLNVNFEGKVAFVTGASSGIGKNIAVALAEAGANVIAVSRSKTKLEKVHEQIESFGNKGLYIPTDVSKVDQIYNAVDQSIKTFGRIDILVNCAGVNIRATVEDYTEEDWDTVIDTNLKGYFFTCQAVGKKSMIPRKEGKIVNINSTMSFVAQDERAAYASSKGGTLQLTKALSIEWAKYNINVNGVAPGWTYTEMTSKLFEDKQKLDMALNMVPLRRIGAPEGVSAAVLYLASNLSDYVTGHTILVDGGWTVW
jgi:NAD(P)-dependent dehydrogenase (short-subunit alcohol dehydrogenase family)